MTPPVGPASNYDAVRGSLNSLRSSGGNFTTAAQACLGNEMTSTSVTFASNPSANNGYFFLVRATTCGGDGTYKVYIRHSDYAAAVQTVTLNPGQVIDNFDISAEKGSLLRVTVTVTCLAPVSDCGDATASV